MQSQQQHMQLNSSSLQTQQLQLQSQQSSHRNFDNQIVYLASVLNNRFLAKLLCDNQVPRQKDVKECKVIGLRSGKELSKPQKATKSQSKIEKQNGRQGMDEENKEKCVQVQKPDPPPTLPKYVPKLSFPQWQQRSKRRL